MKFNPLPEIVSGKRVVVVDDSIVRGNTTRQIIGMLRDAGANEVHLRISAPPIRHPCHYGVDMSTTRGDDRPRPHGRGDRGRARRRLARLPLARRASTRRSAPRARSTATPASPATTRSATAARRTASSRSRRCPSSRAPARRRGRTLRRADVDHRRVNEAELTEALRGQFGHPAFRPGQLEAVEAAVGGARRAAGDADRRRQVALLPAAGDLRPAAGGGRLAAGLADDRPGRGPRRPGRADQRAARPGRQPARRSRARSPASQLLYVAPERFAHPGLRRSPARGARSACSWSTRRTA